MKWACAALAAAAAVAGCGGSHHSDTAAIRAALVASKASYLHYAAPIWWGRPVRARLTSVRRSGKFTVAHVFLPVGRKIERSQWALLEAKSGTWQVLAVVVGARSHLPCKAPVAVMRLLAGGCMKLADDLAGAISGAEATRPPSDAERQAILRAVGRTVKGRDSCATYSVAVSRLLPRYASVDATFHKPNGDCELYNGVAVYERTAGRWKYVTGNSDGEPCTYLPPGVVRSLFGECLLFSPR